jgi:hypothetical protein
LIWLHVRYLLALFNAAFPLPQMSLFLYRTQFINED